MSSPAELQFDPSMEEARTMFPPIPPLVREKVQEARDALSFLSDPKLVLTDPEIMAKEVMLSGAAGDMKALVLRLKNSASTPRPAI